MSYQGYFIVNMNLTEHNFILRLQVKHLLHAVNPFFSVDIYASQTYTHDAGTVYKCFVDRCMVVFRFIEPTESRPSSPLLTRTSFPSFAQPNPHGRQSIETYNN